MLGTGRTLSPVPLPQRHTSAGFGQGETQDPCLLNFQGSWPTFPREEQCHFRSLQNRSALQDVEVTVFQ